MQKISIWPYNKPHMGWGGMGWVSWGIEHITVFKSASDHLKSILTLFWTLSLHKRPFGRDWKYSFGQLDRMGHKAGCSVDINFHLVYVGKVHMQLLFSKKIMSTIWSGCFLVHGLSRTWIYTLWCADRCWWQSDPMSLLYVLWLEWSFW